MELIRGFQWPVPNHFLTPLNFCRFERGDILYDNPIVYELPWDEGKRHLTYSLQVKAPERRPVTADEEESVFETNWISPMILEVTDYRQNAVEIIECTQGALYTALRFGNLKHLRAPAPAPPLRWRSLVRWLRRVCAGRDFHLHPLAGIISAFGCPQTFVLPGDCGSPLTQDKRCRISSALLQDGLAFQVHEADAAALCDSAVQVWAPTSRLYLFGVHGSNNGNLAQVLKRALYRPSPTRKANRDKFQLGKHGVIVQPYPLPVSV